MSTKFTETTKREIVKHYHNGISVPKLCFQYNVARSTIYSWIQLYHPIKTTKGVDINYSEYLKLKKHAEKLEVQLAIIKAAGVVFPHHFKKN